MSLLDLDPTFPCDKFNSLRRLAMLNNMKEQCMDTFEKAVDDQKTAQEVLAKGMPDFPQQLFEKFDEYMDLSESWICIRFQKSLRLKKQQQTSPRPVYQYWSRKPSDSGNSSNNNSDPNNKHAKCRSKQKRPEPQVTRSLAESTTTEVRLPGAMPGTSGVQSQQADHHQQTARRAHSCNGDIDTYNSSEEDF